MTEAGWFAWDDPSPMLRYIRFASDRKLRLAACAYCRLIEARDTRSRKALEYAEQFADGHGTDEERDHHFRHARTAWKELLESEPDNAYRWILFAFSDAVSPSGFNSALTVHVDIGSFCTASGRDWDVDHLWQAEILRDIFGNPFRPVSFSPMWRTSDVMMLARGIYEEKAFDRMPILADALQDAGCDSDDILTHMRDTTATHVRGCWALDLVLGKS